tara:strand:+ start:2815 stop:3468 length:654 start_codon:yes stop_codon:yes gene_type:complete
MKMKLLLLLFFLNCGDSSDWQILFDGKVVKGLRGYKQTDFPSGKWIIKDGALKTVPGHNGIDLISKDMFTDFELELEWKVAPGGNSGIFYFANEEGDYIWQSAPEMQVLDNGVHVDGKNKLTSAGALYAMIEPSSDVTKPVGEYNKVRIKVQDKNVEHWLNGEKILEYTYQSDEMWDLVKSSKFNSMPTFAKAKTGHIGLQGDHGEVWYKNIRIRKL